MKQKCPSCGVKVRFPPSMSGATVDCPECSKPIVLRLSLSESKNLKQQSKEQSPLAVLVKKSSALSNKFDESGKAKFGNKVTAKKSASNSKIMRKPTKPKPQKKESHKETIAKITAENRAYFEKQETKNQTGKKFNANSPQEAKQKSVPMINVQKLDIASLESQVRDSIEQFYSNKPAHSSYQIGNLTLIHESGNKYIGMLEVLNNNEQGTLEVSVVYDGRSFMWKIAEKRNLQSNPIQEIPPEIPPIREMPYTKIPAQIFDNTIRCQMCGSSNIAKIPFPLNTFKSFKCWSCGYKW